MDTEKDSAREKGEEKTRNWKRKKNARLMVTVPSQSGAMIC